MSVLFRFQHSIIFSQIWKRSRDYEHTLLDSLTHALVVLVNINLHTKFEMTRFTHSRDMTGAAKFNANSGSSDPDNALLGVVCYAKAVSWYRLPEYKVSRFEFQGRSCGVVGVMLFGPIDRTPTCDGRTDRQCHSKHRASTASRRNKWCLFPWTFDTYELTRKCFV